MQTLFALVALICFRLQIAQPLATSYDYDIQRGEEFADSENLVHQNPERHGTSHFRPSHSIRHKQHFGINNTETAKELPTPVSNAGTTENSNFHQHLHHQHQNKHEHSKSGLQIELNNRLHRHSNSHNQQRHQEHNSIHTQGSYTRTRHKIASKPMNAMTADNNTITTAEDFKNTAGTMGLVKPTSHPTHVTTNSANTITLDEANKSMQNVYHQPVIRQQQHKQHRQKLHHNHQMQPKSNSSETKITMPSVNEIQPNLSANSEQFRQNEKVVALRSVGYLLSSSHIKEGTGSNVTASVSVGGSTENIAGPASESNSGLSAADDSNERGTVYMDDETEYYDYTGDDEPNTDQHDYQHVPTAADIGYDYDSGIDGDDAEWHVNAANNLKTDHHQHLQLYQEQRRQQWYRQQQKQPQNDQGEHSRVPRDHQRVQSQQFHNNHLYDAHSDDEYPDDEPYRDSSEQFSNRPGDLTSQKFRELGTMPDVQQSHHLYTQRHKTPFDLATDHINRMKVEARCNRPLKRVFHVSNDTSKTYVPSCTILHRCGEDTGCCRSMGQVCTVKTYEDVPVYFIVIQVNSSKSRRQREVEILWLRNDTECHCINRTDLTSTPEFITRDKRSGFTFRRRRPPYFDAMDSQSNQLEDRSDTEENTENYPDDVCHCPTHFNVFQQDIELQSVQQHHEQHSHGAPTVNCFCDCANKNTPCQRLKNGEEGFAMDDRRCIAKGTCSVPNCHFGTYNEQMGRCPRPSRKHKRHNNGFG
ncbi:uncharacterized protein LOC129246881 [Anastrepha obliqua]|uniref:uncharacterized protein LOC129246881 n=1 Tax=Anastrepha obliqua TaxID=95512 RepID=UPI0024091BBF|nr:uncharacterized protein LOC129246881 [Anastrepha obliqua]